MIRALVFFALALVAFWLLFPMENISVGISNVPDVKVAELIEPTVSDSIVVAVQPSSGVVWSDMPPHLHPSQPVTGLDYRSYGAEIRYCWFGNWDSERVQTMLSAFQVWRPTGVTFLPADGIADCDVHLTLENMGDNLFGGAASSGPGIHRLVPGSIRINSFYPLSNATAIHEVGHILGLLHWSEGIMAESAPGDTLPGQAEIDAVKKMWGTQ